MKSANKLVKHLTAAPGIGLTFKPCLSWERLVIGYGADAAWANEKVIKAPDQLQ